MPTEEEKRELWLSPYDRMTGSKRLSERLERWLAWLAWHFGYRLQAKMDIDPRSPWYDPLFVRTFKSALGTEVAATGEANWEDKHDLVRYDMLVTLAGWLRRNAVAGAVAEVGVAGGMTAALLSRAFPASELFLFDTMLGYPPADIAAEVRRTSMHVGPYPRKLDRRALFNALGDAMHRVTLYEGAFPSSAGPKLKEKKFCFVHLDVDLYESTLAALNFFFPLMAEGGMIVVHDYNAWPGAHVAVDEFLLNSNQLAMPMPDKSGSIVISVSRRGAPA